MSLTPQQKKDYRLTEFAHRRELKRWGFTMATTANYGWVGDVDGWCSKTADGILETKRVAPGRYRHIWHDGR